MLWEFFLPMTLKPSMLQSWGGKEPDMAESLNKFIWEHSCVAYVGLIFFGAKGVFSIDICHLFQQCKLILISLIRNYLVNRVCTEFWAGPPLCSAVIFALSGMESALSLFVRIKTPWSVSKVCFWSLVRGRKKGSTPTGKEDTEFSCPRAVHL